MLRPLLAVAAALAGLLLAPAWFAALGTTPLGAYAAGLGLVAIGVVLLAGELARAIGAERRAERPPALLPLSVAALACAGLLLVFEVAALAAVATLGIRAEVRDFRNRQTMVSIPNKVAHPFLILTNNPALDTINRLGFPGRDHAREKPAGTVRIACLGGSTTEDGYPARLETALARDLPETPIEVLNFGIGYWTTAQTLINYALNVKYFSPDYLVVHDGANELMVRGYPEFRTDYAHAFHPMEARPRWDAPLVRHLESYALLKHRYYEARGMSPGLGVGAAVQMPRPSKAEPPIADELRPFRENLTELVHMARRHGTEVLFATQPYSRARSTPHDAWESHMQAVNGIVRSLAEETGALLVDLDPEMTGHEEYFIDPLHLTSDAKTVKAEKIAAALLPILRARGRDGSPTSRSLVSPAR